MPRYRSQSKKVLRSRSSAAGAGSRVVSSEQPPVQTKPLRSRSSANRSATPSCSDSTTTDAVIGNPASEPDQEGAVVNAFWQKSELCLVVRDPAKPSGVRIRRQRAEHSCFISRLDGVKIFPGSKKPIYVMIKAMKDCRSIELEGSWYRIIWNSRDNCKTLCSKLEAKGIKTFEGCVSPVMRHMVDNAVPIANPRKCWVDIETDSRVPFSRAEEDARILCWVVYDEHGNKFEGLLVEDTDKDERRILNELWTVLDNFDLVAAWNGDRFDFPIIKRRTQQRGIKIEWRRWQWLDHMVLFQRMNVAAESGEEKQSFKLDSIANTLLKVGKHNFDASKTWQAWCAPGCTGLHPCMKCRACLLEYCGQDTKLMPMLEEKTGFIQLLRTLGEACGTFSDTRGINPSVQVEGFLQRLALKTGHKFPTVLSLSYGDKYEGAYVMEPTCVGITKNVHVADFSSLYPSIIVTWNMSPETRVKRGEPRDESEDLQAANMSYSPLTKVNFTTDKPGILPAAVQELMRLRKHWNKLKATFPPGSPDWKDADRRSTAYKVAANSFYGVVGSPMSRFFDRKVAESVAQCGKWLILQAVKQANDEGMDVVYADTDSVFVEGASRTEFEVFVEQCNDDLWPRVLKEVGCKENLIDLAYEKQFERIVFSAKKKYVGRYVHYKGTRADPKTSKPEIKGFEYKRGDAVKFARQMQEEVIELLVGYGPDGGCEDPVIFEAVLDRWKDRILHKTLTLEDVVVGKRLKKPLDGYVRKMLKDGSGYARQLPHIEIARQMKGRGEDVGEGVRIEYFIYDGASSPMDCRHASEWTDAAPGHPVKTMGDTIDRFVIWDKQVFPATERLVAAAFPGHDWKPWKKARPAKPRAPRVRKPT